MISEDLYTCLILRMLYFLLGVALSEYTLRSDGYEDNLLIKQLYTVSATYLWVVVYKTNNKNT